MLTRAYNMNSLACEKVQEALNNAAGLNLKAQTPKLNQDRIDGLARRIGSEENYDDVAWILNEPVKTFSRSIVDDSIEANADFQYRAGLSPKIIRIAEAKCCDWCADLAGEYDYPLEDTDVYRRHNNCRCVVDYHPGDGRVQNAHTKQWRDEDAIEARKAFEREIASQQISPDVRKAAAIANQEGGVATIPRDMVGNFDDFEPLTISEDDRKCLSNLKELTDVNGWEYGQIFSDIDQTGLITNNDPGKVALPISEVDGNHLRVYHSHTNDTPPSLVDLTKLAFDKVDSVGVITGNGDVFSVSINGGYRPTFDDFDVYFDDEWQTKFDKNMEEYSGFWEWTPEERIYMTVREQFYTVCREFGWRMEGGRLND